ncbi:MAG: hypothetical protein AAB874_06010 [Patescibacteria group bacterium]
MVSVEVDLPLQFPDGFLTSPFAIPNNRPWNNLYDTNLERARPEICYIELLVSQGIYLPILTLGVPIHELTDENFYWIDKRSGGSGFNRANIGDSPEKLEAGVPYLIRFGKEIVSVCRSNPDRYGFPETGITCIQFIVGQTRKHKGNITIVYQCLSQNSPPDIQTVIESKHLPLARIQCWKYRDF